MTRQTLAGACGLALFAGLPASDLLAAQWIRHPTAGLPRTADGKVNMSAPPPRAADGKPDFSGFWTSDEVDPLRPDVPPNPYDATRSRRMFSIGADIKGGLPYQPWLAEAVKQNRANNMKATPTSGVCR